MVALLTELGFAIGEAFLNPLIYWIFIFILLSSYRRIRGENRQFQKALFPIGSEIKNTWLISISFGLILTILSLIIGFTFTAEMILFLSIFFIVLSFTFGYKMLSASYTIGFTFILIKILVTVNPEQEPYQVISALTFTGLALIVGILLLAEARMYQSIKNESSFPKLVVSKRNVYLGEHHLKKISFIPFFVYLPSSVDIPIITLLPSFSIGDGEISLALIPLAIGFHHTVIGSLPEKAAKSLTKATYILGISVIILSLVSFYLPGMATLAILVALIGRSYLQYANQRIDREQNPYFLEIDHRLKILALVENSPADKLGFHVGDTILKINGQSVQTIDELDKELSDKDIAPCFEVIRNSEELCKISNDQFIGNRSDLGLIFTSSNINK